MSIRKNVDFVKYFDEVTTAQITIVGIVMRFLLFGSTKVLRPSTLRAKFEDEGLTWLAGRII